MVDLNETEREKLREMIESWDSAQVGISFFRVAGEIIKWLAAVLAAIAVLWAALHNGGQP